jgi:hypothetical protein
METITKWIERWYASQCDGDWEHEYGVKIESLDNPGWSVKIDLKFTELEEMNLEYQLFEKDENDWYGFSVKDSVYHGAGDPGKLEFLLGIFKELAESNKR